MANDLCEKHKKIKCSMRCLVCLVEERDQLQGEKKRLMEALSYECPEKYPDNCEICKGTNAGVRGNENRINGKVVCDYCSVALLEEK